MKPSLQSIINMSFPGISLNPGTVIGAALKRDDVKKEWPTDIDELPIRKSFSGVCPVTTSI
jgi:hypothetical protein